MLRIIFLSVSFFLSMAFNSFALVNDKTEIVDSVYVDTIRVGCFDMFYPFQYINEKGKMDGFSVDIIRSVAKRLNLKLIFMTTSSEESYHKLLNHEIDIALNIKKQSSDLSHDDIYQGIHTKYITSTKLLPRSNKLLQCILGDRKVQAKSLYGYTVRSDNSDLLYKLNTIIYKLKNDGSYSEISKKWNVLEKVEVKRQNLVSIICIIYVLILILAILFYYLYRNYLMNKRKCEDQMIVFSVLIDKISLPIYIKNNSDEGTILYRNQSYLDIFGDKEDESSDYSFSKIPIKQLRNKEHFDVDRNIKIERLETRKDIKGNNIYSILMRNIFEIEDKTYIVTVRNIINDIVEARKEAENAKNLKVRFLANMGHEIRTPLTAIIGFSEILGDTKDVDEMKSFVDVIEDNTDLLISLIDDIIKLSSYQTGNIPSRPSWINVNKFFHSLYLTYDKKLDKMEKHDIELFYENSLSENAQLYIDQRILMQIMTNYLNNAIKYTIVGNIRFGVHYVDKKAEFYVEDTGIGIPKDQLPFVFTRFEKLDNVAEGHGLGMAICKSIADSLNAEVGVSSEEGVGSVFYFNIMIPYRDKIV